MEKFILLPIIVFLLSCGTSRKVQEATRHSSVDSVAVEQTQKGVSEKVVDTTRTESGKIVITEITFGASCGQESHDTRASPDKEATLRATTNIQGFGEVSGNIRTIRQTIIESDKQAKGKSGERKKQEESKSNANVSRKESDKQMIATPTANHRWKYAFYMSMAFVVILLYLKRVPILNWIRKILAGIRRLF